MKLNAVQTKRIEEEFGVETISEDHPVYPNLKETFGDHTFVMDTEGLNIVEPESSAEGGNGKVVRLASWTEDRTALKVHAPQFLPVIVKLQADD